MVAKAYPIELYDKQHRFCSSDKFLVGLVGGRGCGKTHIGCVNTLMTAKNEEPWLAVSPDSGVVSVTTFPLFETLAKRYSKWLKSVQSPFHKVWFRTLDGGTATIVFRSAEKPDKLRGSTNSHLWLDEASVMQEEVFNVAVNCLRHKRKRGQVFFTMTPRGVNNWTFEKFYKPIDERQIGRSVNESKVHWFNGGPYIQRADTELIHARSDENPFLPPDFVELRQAQFSKEYAKQELGGEFVSIGGLMFKREQFKMLEPSQVPLMGSRVRYWDKAATEDGGCWTVGVLMNKTPDGRYVVEHVVRKQVSWRERKQIMFETAMQDSLHFEGAVEIYIEQEAGSGGRESADQDVMMLAQFPVYVDKVAGSQFRKQGGVTLPGHAKVIRAQPFSAAVENGLVYVVKSGWTQDYLAEMSEFPESMYSDQVDASSGAFNKLANRASAFTAPSVMMLDMQTRAGKLLDQINEPGKPAEPQQTEADGAKRWSEDLDLSELW